MGLTATLKNAINTAFAAIGDLKDEVVYTSITLVDYTPDTGAIVNSINDTTITDVVLVQFKFHEIDGAIIQEGDKKAIFPVDRLADEPKVDDYLTINSERWNVIKLMSPHKSSIYTLLIRKQ